MPPTAGLHLRVVALALFATCCHATSRLSLRHAQLDASKDINGQLEEVNKNKDMNELDCLNQVEKAQAARIDMQTRVANAERALQAAAAAEVQLKVQHGSLYAKAGSIEARRDDLKRLCTRLQDGRDSENKILKDTSNISTQIMDIVGKMQGDYSAKFAKVQGSQEDQKAYQELGSKVCSTKLGDTEKELAAANAAIQDVAQQLGTLDDGKAQAERTRVLFTQKLVDSQTGLGAMQTGCKQKSAEIEKQIRDLQAQRANVHMVDCEVSSWSHGTCSKKCGGGTKVLTREIVRRAFGGAACPSLSATVNCNTQVCDVQCKLGAWSAWSECTKACNGGHQTRKRTVRSTSGTAATSFLQQPAAMKSASAETAMFDVDEAAACGLTQDVRTCNTQTCTGECALGEWGSWGPCTKACGGGQRGRKRLKSPGNLTLGGAACSGWQNEFESCKSEACPSVLSCGARQDLVVMVDSSELLEPAEFKAQKDFVGQLMLYMQMDRANHALTGLVFFGNGTEAPSLLPLSESVAAVQKRLDFAKTGRGGLHLDLGFDAAMSLFTGWSGRNDAPRTALVLLKGKPDSVSKSIERAAKLKEFGIRVVVAVVGSCIVNKQQLAEIASEPTSDNLFYFQSYQELKSLVGLQAVKLCPSLTGGKDNLLPLQYLPLPGAATK